MKPDKTIVGAILIVDDHPDLRLILRQVLEGEGYECMEANDGKMALQMLEEDPSISLVITDFNMPRMNGLQLLAHMSQHPLLLRIPTLFVTAEYSVDLCLNAIQYGANHILFKPYDFTKLRRCVHTLLAPLQVA